MSPFFPQPTRQARQDPTLNTKATNVAISTLTTTPGMEGTVGELSYASATAEQHVDTALPDNT